MSGYRYSRQDWAFFVGLLMLSLSLRIFHITAGFWGDELATITMFSRKAWLDVITNVPYPNNHILYTLLLKLSVSLLGEREWTARLPSLALGALTPSVAYLLLTRRFSKTTALAASFFMALNYWMVWFSQDARGYAGMILFSLLGNYFFDSYLENPNRRAAVAYVICAGLAVQFHLYAGFLIAAQFFWGLGLSIKRRTVVGALGWVVLAGCLGAGLYVPGAVQLWHYTATIGRQRAEGAIPVRLGTAVLQLTLMLAGSNRWKVAGLMALAALPGGIALFRRRAVFAGSYLLATLLALGFTAAADVFIFPRFLFFLFPPFALSLALTVELACARISGRYLRASLTAAFAAIICVVFAWGLPSYYRLGKEHYKDIAAYARKTHPGMAVATNLRGLAYYLPEAGALSSRPGITPEMVRGKLVLVRKFEWDHSRNFSIKSICRPEKIWTSAGYEEDAFVLLNCSAAGQ